jgi:hypothetical protein
LRLSDLAREISESGKKNISRKGAKVKIPKKEATFVFKQGE